MDKAHGSGEYKYNNGDVYVGEFKEGLYHGEGKKTYANGAIEEGRWIEGKFQRIAIFVHGTNVGTETWTENLNTIPILLEIAKTQRCDAKFSWKGLNGLKNDYNDRKKAAEMLIKYVQQYKDEYEEIVFIAHSHGGNVALQAIDKLVEFKKIYLLTLTTPAYNCEYLTKQYNSQIPVEGQKSEEFYSPIEKAKMYKITEKIGICKENPKNINKLYKHINISKKGDMVSGQITMLSDKNCFSDDGYNENGITKDIKIDCNASTGGHSIQQSTGCLNVIKQQIGNTFIK
jgi:hypothetical protein